MTPQRRRRRNRRRALRAAFLGSVIATGFLVAGTVAGVAATSQHAAGTGLAVRALGRQMPAARLAVSAAKGTLTARPQRLSGAALAALAAPPEAHDPISARAGAQQATPRTTPPWRVGMSTLHLVDRSRPAPARLGGRPGRGLDVVLTYPVDGDPADATVRGAPPAAAGGGFPLIVFAHGYNVTPTTYEALTTGWARAGYVVASPAFPGEVAGTGDPDQADLINEPADISFVISSVLVANRSPGILHGALNPGRIGVAGHSDGGEAAAAIGLNSCCRDARISAVLVMSGAELTVAGGSYAGTRHAPSLIIQARGDEINDPSNAVQLFADSPGPAFYLDLADGRHLESFTGTDPRWAIVPRATTDFWDLELRGGPTRLRRFEQGTAGAAGAHLYVK